MKKIIAPIFALFMLACQDNDAKVYEEPTAEIETLNEYALANQIFQDIGNNGGDAILNAENSTIAKTSDSKSGPVITVEPFDLSTFPKTTTVDFKDGTLCKDGITRSGIITIVSTGWYRQEESEHTTTFDDYYHEDYKVEGTHLVRNLGTDQDNNPRYSVTINNGKISANNGAAINYTEDSFRTWIAGSDTPLNIWDDEYLLEGEQSGISSKGIGYALTIEEPLHFVLLPRNIKSGILDLDIGEVNDIKLNYNNSTVTILGVTYIWN
ncbi:hypothetical protein VOI54_11780 [Tamlana sp. 2201CG12-4]|uniref:hypothetical protein n=1 Tax=Tamlana sp. 2201CG12-4 TaxID=3112582 RepID=UPI002DBA5F58|nr:hypothetical protein [Tamlana sp. 2201CG12-4]MEC3907701.1 hypothetical protein [Tamlana sp. 2201CG12-4]